MPPLREFILVIGMMVALSALSVDTVLPAFQNIIADFKLDSANEAQKIVYLYMTGFALGQLVYGPLSDAIGRRVPALSGLVIYALGSIGAALSADFDSLLTARFIQGVGVAGCRVLAVAIIRDTYQEREMSRVLSLAQLVFITVAIGSPLAGSVLLIASGWRAIYVGMFLFSVVVIVWFSLRIPETARRSYGGKRPADRLQQSFRLILRSRLSVGSATAVGWLLACLTLYVACAPQIFQGLYGAVEEFPLIFSSLAAFMGLAHITNAIAVRRIGSEALVTLGLLGLTLSGASLFCLVWTKGADVSLATFAMLLSSILFLITICLNNLIAIAMLPLGSVAGTASSLIGFYSTLIGTIFGAFAGRSFDGTVLPFSLSLLLFGVAAALAFHIGRWLDRKCAAREALRTSAPRAGSRSSTKLHSRSGG